MTRNEWIAETAARLAASEATSSYPGAVSGALELAILLENSNVAPWQTPHPAPTPSVEAEAVGLLRRWVNYYFVESNRDAGVPEDARVYIAKLDANGGAT